MATIPPPGTTSSASSPPPPSAASLPPLALPASASVSSSPPAVSPTTPTASTAVATAADALRSVLWAFASPPATAPSRSKSHVASSASKNRYSNAMRRQRCAQLWATDRMPPSTAVRPRDTWGSDMRGGFLRARPTSALDGPLGLLPASPSAMPSMCLRAAAGRFPTSTAGPGAASRRKGGEMQ